MTTCRCLPGDPETGWHEQRAPECLKQEYDAWRQLFARLDEKGREPDAKLGTRT